MGKQVAPEPGQHDCATPSALGLWIRCECRKRAIDRIKHVRSRRDALGRANAAEMRADASQHLIDGCALLRVAKGREKRAQFARKVADSQTDERVIGGGAPDASLPGPSER